ncbi:MAG: tetratricopeptide repeat protein, partial [Polyangiaceae bacterium]
MRRFFGAALFLAGCAASAPSPSTSTIDPRPSTSTSTIDQRPSTSDVDAGVPSLPTASTAYPPAKPTTISLASTGDAKLDALLKAGDDAFEANDLGNAEKHYEEARVLAPKKSAPIVGMDRVKIAKTNVPYDFAAAKGNAEISAISGDLKKAVKMEPSLGAGQVELGRALLLLGDARGAIDALKKGAELLPNEAEAHSALGVAWLATGHPEEAMQEMGEAAKLDPGSAARHENYGTTLLMRGKTKEAMDEYRASIAIDPNDARSHSDLGTALLGDNQVVMAIPELQKAIQ